MSPTDARTQAAAADTQAQAQAEAASSECKRQRVPVGGIQRLKQQQQQHQRRRRQLISRSTSPLERKAASLSHFCIIFSLLLFLFPSLAIPSPSDTRCRLHSSCRRTVRRSWSQRGRQAREKRNAREREGHLSLSLSDTKDSIATLVYVLLFGISFSLSLFPLWHKHMHARRHLFAASAAYNFLNFTSQTDNNKRRRRRREAREETATSLTLSLARTASIKREEEGWRACCEAKRERSAAGKQTGFLEQV